MGSAEMDVTREVLRGFCRIADTCVAALTRLPDERVLADLADVASALGHDAFSAFKASPALIQRFYDRAFVPTSPAYVPLYEDSIRGAHVDDAGIVRYAAIAGRHHDHVVGCYAAAGFDFHAIKGFELAVQRLHATSFASELAFLSSLASAAEGLYGNGDGEGAAHAVCLARTFAASHPLRWFGAAAGHLARFDDDLYANVCRLAAEAVGALADR